MDKIDRKILSVLEGDARISFADLALKVGLSKTPCWNRVKELELKGVISAYTARVDPYAIGLEVQAIVQLVLNFGQADAFEESVLRHEKILHCFAVTGDYDYVLHVVAKNIRDLDEFLRSELSQFSGVERFSTAISTRSIKEIGRLLPISEKDT
ncbi:Lrp/AsnC family transcriptional regulator [Glaciecola petra]|uniref:Lrp/AsnC family transcriptional regulator n=1 Tax=Glaciecola petra TaxID=3075602 RepID=A0ABU2ZP27_9ALTE|nr:Lrp/AsnC family transcriptional regulator [Aestuariibacter sp. P117]MDT0594377.1 Lrp/AsnC family transcriptional regulator [Aestuariibacter sp. P117]